MSEFHPDLDTQNEVSNLLDDLTNRLRYLLGVDEVIPACEVIDMDPRGDSPALPRFIQVRIHQYYQEVMYRGFPTSLTVGDFITVIHIREGDQYEVLGAGGTTGIVPAGGGVGTPPHFSPGEVLLNLTFDHLKFWNDDLTQRYGFLTSRRDRAWIWPNSTDYDSRGSLSMVPSLWPFRRAFRCDRDVDNLVTNPSFETNTTGWAQNNTGGLTRTKEWAWSQIWALAFTATAQYGHPYYNIAAAPSTNQYSASIWVRTDGYPVYLNFRNVTTATSATSSYHPADGQWHRLVANNLPVTAGDQILIRVEDARAGSWTQIQVDAAQIEETAYHTPYCDGDLGDGNAWSAVNHASAPSRQSGYIRLSDLDPTISGRDSFSVRSVVQVPYDADFAYWPVDPSPIWDARGADNNNRIQLRYNSTNDTIDVYINGAIRLASSVQTWDAGEWLDIVIKFNFFTDDYNLYINGVQEDTDSTPLAAPVLYSWILGSDIITANQECGWTFAEYTVYSSDSLLTETLIDQLYLTGPTIDPESVLEERTNPPGFWDHLCTAESDSTPLAVFTELGGSGHRFLLAGDWATGHWHLEVSGYQDPNVGQGEAKLQYYDEINATWRDVPGSLVAITAGATNRYLSGPASMIRSMHEFRTVFRHNTGAAMVTILHSRVFNSHGGDTAL